MAAAVLFTGAGGGGDSRQRHALVSGGAQANSGGVGRKCRGNPEDDAGGDCRPSAAGKTAESETMPVLLSLRVPRVLLFLIGGVL